MESLSEFRLAGFWAYDELCGSYASKPDRTITSGLSTIQESAGSNPGTRRIASIHLDVSVYPSRYTDVRYGACTGWMIGVSFCHWPLP
jgi:hypothetical protein